MRQDYVGLFNTPPTRTQIRAAVAAIGVLLMVMAIALALPNNRLREVNVVAPMVDAIMFLSDLITATLLYVTASVYRSRAVNVLASGFAFMALLLIPHVLSFPGVFALDGLLGAGVSTTAWTFISRRAALPIVVILYVLMRRAELSGPPEDLRPAPSVTVALSLTFALTMALTALVTLGQNWLPPLFLDQIHTAPGAFFRVNLVMIPLFLAAIAIVWWQCRSVFDLWLMVTLWAVFIMLPINMRDWGRFTVGFYAQWALMPISNLILMLALLAESSRLHLRLALSTAARKRDRDALLMSIDAVVAAFSHEIGQPLTAVTTNARAGLNYLTRSRPDVPKAVDALRSALDAGKDTIGVIKSLRAMVAQERGMFTQFSVNDVACHVAAMLSREMTSARVTLELLLDDTLPPVQADRVQVQQILTNLMINAIDAVSEGSSGVRNIVVRSRTLEPRAVLIEVSDTGRGIPPGESERIFETFVTTKTAGTGLGLSISRILAEEQGGRLWAAPANGQAGATFCFQLPCI